MQEIILGYQNTKNLHHAYALGGDREQLKNKLFSFLETEVKFPVKNNPDFWSGEFNVFKIADSRSINILHLNKPVKYDRKIFLICANFLTKDAQNSLLKMLEEPQAHTTFFLIIPSAKNLIPTLRSRLMIFEMESDTSLGQNLAVSFLKANIGKRLEIVSDLLKNIKADKATKVDVLVFLQNLETLLKGKKMSVSVIEDIEAGISYANDESPSLKIILEHLALVL